MNFSKSTSASNRLSPVNSLGLVIGLVLATAPVHASDSVNANIDVVYPSPDQIITARDSTFILGNVNVGGDYELVWFGINGREVDVHPGGGFLAFLPVTPGVFVFRLEADFVSTGEDYIGDWRRRRTDPARPPAEHPPLHVSDSVFVFIPLPVDSLTVDSLLIVGETDPPAGDLVLTAGDLLRVGITGTPGCRGWFSIPGVADSVPLVERSALRQAYWGESVFGGGSDGGSNSQAGEYVGYYRVTAEDRLDSVHIVYHLAPPVLSEIVWAFLFRLFDPSTMPAPYRLGIDDTSSIEAVSSFAVTFNHPDYPHTVEFTDSVQIVRHGPKKGYLTIFQPAGVRALVIGAEGRWLRVRLSESLTGWVNRAAVADLPEEFLPPRSYLRSIRTHSEPDRLVVKFPLSGKHPFRVIEEGERTLRVFLYGVISDTDWIRYDFGDRLLRLATWSQLEDDVYEFRLELNGRIWGYDCYYEGNTFCLQLNRPPDRVHSLKNKTVVVDPGHSADPGAVGPTRYTEADANLGVSLKLKRELESRGAHVVMTRSDSSHVDLYDRPAIARASDADLFISIHNNALPDGVNPFVNNGTSSYYYHPHSMALARYIHAQMIKATELPDHGLYHGNLAVIRPTQYPAVLVECAFMIIPEQEALLKTEKFRKKVARAIRKGIEEFLKSYDSD